VPNSELVTGQVTNWTYGDQLRRIQLPVGVNYGADPKKVIALLQDVAHKHPRVLDDPPARALFMSYGDSSINFELRAWTDEYLHWQDVRSDLAIAAYDAVSEAGMSFPFPQREIHLVHQAFAPSAEPESEQTSSVARNGSIAPQTTDDQSSGKSAEKSGDKADADL